MALLLLAPLVQKLMHRSEESFLIVEDDEDQKAKAQA
jgi:putative tricarboxylic transport membrane protein